MVKFTVRYKDKTYQEYEGIIKAQYGIPMIGLEVIEEDNLFSCDYPIGPNLQLFSDKKTFKIVGSEIRSIEVEKM